ncbi:hypothetical protein B0T22DRAFT_535894 [Podospora appendiculata]|uniref:FAD-binding domain-containing protein n=1 Tax=Podospora appendiculata TaxID=314037 RepID=A0AAE1CCR6_9PEZI|nr:hypothetical protein B0T22DRAFT_535894 [Podospora appendiculata]
MTEIKNPLPRVAIIGAGVTGLLLAHGLQKNGFQVTVYDKETHIGEKTREWTMLLHWALPTLQKMLPASILNGLRPAYTDPFYPYDQEKESIPYYNGTTGQIVFHTPVIARRLSRTRLRTICAGGLDVQWGRTFTGLELAETTGPVTIRFLEGGSRQADLVIGADGANSTVRGWLVGQEAARSVRTEYAIANGIVRYETAEIARAVRAPHPVFSLASLPGGVIFSGVQNVVDPEDPATWSFHISRVWKGPVTACEGEEAIALVKTATVDFAICEPFRTAIQAIPADANVFVTQLSYWPTVPWDNRGGRVTLAGDAAHSILPTRAQGLNEALSDVDQIITQFIKIKDKGLTVEDALRVYEDDVFVRGRKAALASVEDTKALTQVRDMQSTPQARSGFTKAT